MLTHISLSRHAVFPFPYRPVHMLRRAIILVLLFFFLYFDILLFFYWCFFFQAEDGIRYLVRSRGLGDVYKRQAQSFLRYW